MLTLRVKQDLCLQKGTGECFHHVVHTQQREGISKGILPQWELPWPRTLAHNGSLHPMELQRPARRRQGHLIQNIMDVAFQRQGRGCVRCHGLVQLRQKLSSGLKEGEGCEETKGFRHKQGVSSRIKAAGTALTGGHARQRLCVRLIQAAHKRVHARGGGRGGRGRGRGGR